MHERGFSKAALGPRNERLWRADRMGLLIDVSRVAPRSSSWAVDRPEVCRCPAPADELVRNSDASGVLRGLRCSVIVTRLAAADALIATRSVDGGAHRSPVELPDSAAAGMAVAGFR